MIVKVAARLSLITLVLKELFLLLILKRVIVKLADSREGWCKIYEYKGKCTAGWKTSIWAQKDIKTLSHLMH